MTHSDEYHPLLETQLDRIEQNLDRALREEAVHRTRIYVWLTMLSVSIGGTIITHIAGLL